MKKVLFLLLVTSISYGQALFDKGIKITGGITTDNSATQVVVKSANNVLNTIAKNDLIDVVIVNTTAELTAGIGNVSKLYATRDNTIIYRYNGTIYVPLGGDISSKEDIANKSSSFTASSTVTYANTKALVDGLAIKSNDADVVHKSGVETITGVKSFSPTVSAVTNLARGTIVNPTLTATGNNDVLAGLDISTTFNNGGFTGVKNYALMYLNGSNTLTVDVNGVLKTTADLDARSLFLNTAIYLPNSQLINNTGFKATAFTKSGATATNILLAGGEDITQASLSISTATQTALNLKANLASPTFTGVPIVPTATAGTNTGQAASAAFVTGAITTADSGNVKTTGNQGITGTKTFYGGIDMFSSSIQWLSAAVIPTGSQTATITRINNDVSVGTGNANIKFASFNTIGLSTNRGFTFPDQSGTFALTNNPTSLTATSFINSTAPATNALLANGTTLANPISGTATTGYLPKVTSAGVIGNSIVSESGANLQVAGNIVSGGLVSGTGQLTSSGSTTTTMFALENANENRVYLIIARQSGSANNSVMGYVTSYGSNSTALNIAQSNTNPVLFMTVASSGLEVKLTTGSGYGSTTWDWMFTRIK